MPRKCEELTAEFDFERNVFGNAGDDERTIIGLTVDGTTIKGRARAGALETGLTYRFYGHWTEHPKYGRQFIFQSFTLAVPSGKRGTVAYLQRGPGIGRSRATAIWDLFGTGSLEAVRTRPEEVAAAVKGITPEVAKTAAAYFQNLAGLESITIDLTELLGSRSFPRRLIEDVIGEWGNAAPEMIRENPYRLMKFRGVGFLRADALYLELGLPADSLERQAYCLWHCLHVDTDGNTWIQAAKAVEHLRKNIAGGELMPGQAAQVAVQERLITVREVGGVTWVAEYQKAAAEKRVAGYVHKAELEMEGVVNV